MKQRVAALAAGLVLLTTPAHAAVTFEMLFEGGYPLAVSNDGSVIAGNLSNGGYGPFRWTQADGPAYLGRVAHAGGGGKPGISADGTKVASSIAMEDSAFTTQGLWTLGSGWQELMPPTPPDGGFMDGTLGNVWGLSGDGTTVVGLYWRPGARAHASKWTAAGGVVDLGGTTSGQASRANGVDYDGSTIVGWVETPTGPWRPAAWDNGSLVLLTSVDPTGVSVAGTGEARAVSQNGNFIVGFSIDGPSRQRAAAMWTRTAGVFGPVRILGWVDGTTPEYGINSASAVSEDGSIAIGYCSFDGDPFFTTGFLWTEQTGVIDVAQYLADNGVLVDPNFQIFGLTTMTPDGTRLYGYGQSLTPPYTRSAFRITRTGLVDAPAAAPLARVELSAPAPNPSASTSRMEFSLPAASRVELTIHDTAGRRVATLLAGDAPAGRNAVTWNGRDAAGRPVSPGVYFARLVTDEGTVGRRIVRVN